MSEEKGEKELVVPWSDWRKSVHQIARLSSSSPPSWPAAEDKGGKQPPQYTTMLCQVHTTLFASHDQLTQELI